MRNQDDHDTLPPGTLPETDPPPPPWAAKLFSEFSAGSAAFFAAAADMREATRVLEAAAADYHALNRRLEDLEAKAAE